MSKSSLVEREKKNIVRHGWKHGNRHLKVMLKIVPDKWITFIIIIFIINIIIIIIIINIIIINVIIINIIIIIKIIQVTRRTPRPQIKLHVHGTVT